MFESTELGQKVDKATWAEEMPPLREALLAAQYELLAKRKFQVLVVIGGVDGAGKGETVNLLNEWLDPRHIHTRAFPQPSEEEVERPPMWRFWRELPKRGFIGIHFGSWYTRPIVARANGDLGRGEFEAALENIVRLERMLADEGTLLLKVWFHLAKPAQKKRLQKLEADPDTRWRVTALDWKNYKRYEKFRKTSDRALRVTATPSAPWLVVDGSDARHRSLTVGRALLAAMRARLDTPEPVPAQVESAQPEPASDVAEIESPDVLQQLDLTRRLDDETYDRELERWQGCLNLLIRERKFRNRSLVLVFEGADAAGKGGAIRRVSAALDARQMELHAIAAPTDEEKAQPYLWRFWRRLPRQGRVAVFDRSWYGRVLVERVEGYCTEADWQRAYSEINEFERQLVDNGAIVVKFWLQVSPEEQLRRFEEREATPWKKFKLTADDWRNRDRWHDYHRAVCDMVEQTSTGDAPWTLVAANDKSWARIEILRTICVRLQAAM